MFFSYITVFNQRQMLKNIIIFLIINFAALGIGGFFTGPGVTSDWYIALNQAPWTPPGWVFGTAWTVIMLIFSIYLGILWGKLNNKRGLIVLFTIQLVLNISWNIVFFYFHDVMLGVIIISSLTVLLVLFFAKYWNPLKIMSFLVLPYILWLCIATSLNMYIMVMN